MSNDESQTTEPAAEDEESSDVDDLFLPEDEDVDEIVRTDDATGESVGADAGGDDAPSDGDDEVDVEEAGGAGGEADGDPVGDPSAGEELSETELLRQQIEELTAERDEWKDRLYRKAADYENLKRRATREREDIRKFANESVFKELLGVFDDLDRALEHMRQQAEDSDNQTVTNLVQGVEMVYRKFVSVLERFGVQGFEAQGKPFDPTLHEALQQIDDESVPANTVVTVFQKGFLLQDRLLRPALVAVSRGGPAQEDAEGKDSTEQGEVAEAGSERDDPSDGGDTSGADENGEQDRDGESLDEEDSTGAGT